MGADKKTILVVEDECMAITLSKMFFEMLGYQTEHADDGDKAVKLAKEKQYAGIYMDIGLPTMSGLDACLAIREHEINNNLPQVPIIAVTGNCSPDEVEKYMTAGMQDVISKPFTKDKAEHFVSLLEMNDSNES